MLLMIVNQIRHTDPGLGTCLRFWSFCILSSWIQLGSWVGNLVLVLVPMYCPGVLHGCQQLVQPGSKRVANSRETVGSLLNSQRDCRVVAKQSGDCRVGACSCTSRAISRCTSRCASRLSTAGFAGIQKVANSQKLFASLAFCTTLPSLRFRGKI